MNGHGLKGSRRFLDQALYQRTSLAALHSTQRGVAAPSCCRTEPPVPTRILYYRRPFHSNSRRFISTDQHQTADGVTKDGANNQQQSTETSSPTSSSSSTSQSSSSSSSSSSNSSSSSSRPRHSQQRSLSSRIWSFIVLGASFYLFHEYVAAISSVRGSSMQPTLNPSLRSTRGQGNDVVLVNKLAALWHRYQRGEIVALTSPAAPELSTVKRIVALPGDWVVSQEDPTLITMIPPGRVWLEGDNRWTSVDDSRTHGPIPMALLHGRVSAIVWPPRRIQRLRPTLEPAGGEERIRVRGEAD